MSTRSPIPFVQSPPRQGTYQERFPNSDQVKIEGTYKDGLKTGSWKTYHPNGQLESDYEWDRGVQHGHELDWSASGQQTCKGENHRGKRTGKWCWWYDDGTFHQSYIYKDGKRHGWTLRCAFGPGDLGFARSSERIDELFRDHDIPQNGHTQGDPRASPSVLVWVSGRARDVRVPGRSRPI